MYLNRFDDGSALGDFRDRLAAPWSFMLVEPSTARTR
jgi:hypothetical protein